MSKAVSQYFKTNVYLVNMCLHTRSVCSVLFANKPLTNPLHVCQDNVGEML